MSFKQFFLGKPTQSFEEAIGKLGLSQQTKFIQMEQVHGADCSQVKTDLIKGRVTKLKQVDACFTNNKNICLSVKTADCLPIIISGTNSKHQEFIAVAHAGRKGTEKKILIKLLKRLDHSYNLKHSRITVWFGPAICSNCYQINREQDLHFNLIQENKNQLETFLKDNQLDTNLYLELKIETHCTLHEPQKYYSYRKTGPGVKMNYSFITLV